MGKTDDLLIVSSWEVSVLQDCSGAIFMMRTVPPDAEDLDDLSRPSPELRLGLTIEMLRLLQQTLGTLIPTMEAGMRPGRH
jgi:hypothetical protein